MSEAEGVAKRAEEELVVAKERLLLQEDELQSRAGTLDHSPSVIFLANSFIKVSPYSSKMKEMKFRNLFIAQEQFPHSLFVCCRSILPLSCIISEYMLMLIVSTMVYM